MVRTAPSYGDLPHSLRASTESQGEGCIASSPSFSKIPLEHDTLVSRGTLYSLLQKCAKHKDVKSARVLHRLIISNGFEFDVFLSDHLLRLFAACGKLLESRQVFCKISKPTLYSWNATMQAHAKLGGEETAIAIFDFMQRKGIETDKCTYCSVLKACASGGLMYRGFQIHDQVINIGIELDLHVGSSLVHMYAKCGSLDAALMVFNTLSDPDVVSWGALMSGYLEKSDNVSVLERYKTMQEQGRQPNPIIMSHVLKACKNMGTIENGKVIHDMIIKGAFESDNLVNNSLIDMYASDGYLSEAYKLFINFKSKDIVSWGVMISGYVVHRCMPSAFQLFGEMQESGMQLSQPIVLSILKACIYLDAIGEGRIVHDQIIKDNLEADVVIASGLIDMYGKCGHVMEGHHIFQHMQDKDVAMWGTLIAAYCVCGLGQDALHLYSLFERGSLSADEGIVLSLLKACGITGDIKKGLSTHILAMKCGYVSSSSFGSALISMYSKCGKIEEAEKMFYDLHDPDQSSWTAMIEGYAQANDGALALELYLQLQDAVIQPDAVLYRCLLKACNGIRAVWAGKFIHSEILCEGYESDMNVCDSLIEMYATCGSLKDALIVFSSLPNQSIFSWTALIQGCVVQNNEILALKLFEKMQKLGTKLDRPLYLCVARACANIGSIMEGWSIHDQILKSGIDDHDVAITNMLVHMYCKCGNLEEACQAFASIRNPDIFSWSILIAGCVFHGDYIRAKQCLEKVKMLNVKPDDTLSTCIFSAYSRSGDLDTGAMHLNTLNFNHGIAPSVMQYNSMIDNLCRTGFLHEADDMLQTMSISPIAASWSILIASCEVYGNRALGKLCFDKYV